MQARICNILNSIVKDIQEKVVSSNDQSQKRKRRRAGDGDEVGIEESLVFFTQQVCDKALANQKESILQRIQTCAKIVKVHGAGNCMMKSYVAFDEIIKHLIQEKIITLEETIPISICMTKDHSFVLLGDYICDPWSNFAGPFAESKYFGERKSNYFLINKHWQCFHGKSYDVHSTKDTYTLFLPVVEPESEEKYGGPPA
jgi:hypothetical protein